MWEEQTTGHLSLPYNWISGLGEGYLMEESKAVELVHMPILFIYKVKYFLRSYFSSYTTFLRTSVA